MQAFTIPRTPVMLFIAQMAYDFFYTVSLSKQANTKQNKQKKSNSFSSFLHAWNNKSQRLSSLNERGKSVF